MSEPAPNPASPIDLPLPRALLVALMQAAKFAVERINLAGAVQLQQPAQAPSEAATSREQLVLAVVEPIAALWNALEPDQLRDAGSHLAIALIREMVNQNAQGLTVLRQFMPRPDAASGPPATS